MNSQENLIYCTVYSSREKLEDCYIHYNTTNDRMKAEKDHAELVSTYGEKYCFKLLAFDTEQIDFLYDKANYGVLPLSYIHPLLFIFSTYPDTLFQIET
jgi:hypothetical protein